MKGFIKDNCIAEVTAPYAVASGAGCLVGALFGIAMVTAAINEAVNIALSGVFSGVAKATGTAWTAGDLLYWDNTAKELTKVSAANRLVGVAFADAASGDATGSVYLPGMLALTGAQIVANAALFDLADVTADGEITTGQVLKYDTDHWENGTDLDVS